MNKPRKLSSKICSNQLAIRRIRATQKNGGRVVFTNGCFDLLHEGHVTYLERARSLGDLLVVALNTDSSVRRLKGPTRPINRLKSRQKVIAALESVDIVVSFSESTPLKSICALRPDLLVKGGDWKVSQIVGSNEVISWGGKARSLSFVEGHSSTRLIAKAKISR